MTSTQRLQLGTAPDSWGVWFAEDDHQVGWKQYLDDAANAGYVWTELGPQGFLPQDPQQLRDELDQRGLKVCGGTVFAGCTRARKRWTRPSPTSSWRQRCSPRSAQNT